MESASPAAPAALQDGFGALSMSETQGTNSPFGLPLRDRAGNASTANGPFGLPLRDLASNASTVNNLFG